MNSLEDVLRLGDGPLVTLHCTLVWSTDGSSRTNGSQLAGDPEPNASSYQTQPDHEVILLGTIESSHSIAEGAWVDEERRDSGDGVML